MMQKNVWKRTASYGLLVLMASLMVACGGSSTTLVERDPVPIDNDHDHHDHESGARLLVVKPGHHDHILVFDLAENTQIADMHVNSTVTALHASPSYRYGIVVQGGDDGTVSFIDSGVEWDDHGDHGHLHLEIPRMLSFGLGGARPAHVTRHNNQTAIFFDGVADSVPAEIHVFSEGGIVIGQLLASLTETINQHGAAQIRGDYLISTVRVPEATGPDRIKVSERHGDHYHEEELFDAEGELCPRLHGSAQNAEFVAFGCADGVLVIEQHGDHFHAHKIDNDTRISTVLGHEQVRDFVGAGRNDNADPISLFTINPETETVTTIAYSHTPRAYAFAEGGELFLILDTDGGLTALSTDDWSVSGERLQVTAAAEDGSVFRLTVSADGEHAYVADTGAQKILAVDVHDWALDDDSTLELDFIPGAILWLGSTEVDDGHHH